MYNPWIDVAVLGAFIVWMAWEIFKPRKVKPYTRYHMVDQSKRWER